MQVVYDKCFDLYIFEIVSEINIEMLNNKKASYLWLISELKSNLLRIIKAIEMIPISITKCTIVIMYSHIEYYLVEYLRLSYLKII